MLHIRYMRVSVLNSALLLQADAGVQLKLEPTQHVKAEPSWQEVPQIPIQDYRPMQDCTPCPAPRIQEQKFATPLPMKKLEQITPRSQQHQPYEHQATPQLPRQPEACFKPPARPSEQEHKFKTPAVTQEVIVVNRVAYSVGQRIGRGGSSEVFQVGHLHPLKLTVELNWFVVR